MRTVIYEVEADFPVLLSYTEVAGTDMGRLTPGLELPMGPRARVDTLKNEAAVFAGRDPKAQGFGIAAGRIRLDERLIGGPTFDVYTLCITVGDAHRKQFGMAGQPALVLLPAMWAAVETAMLLSKNNSGCNFGQLVRWDESVLINAKYDGSMLLPVAWTVAEPEHVVLYEATKAVYDAAVVFSDKVRDASIDEDLFKRFDFTEPPITRLQR